MGRLPAQLSGSVATTSKAASTSVRKELAAWTFPILRACVRRRTDNLGLVFYWYHQHCLEKQHEKLPDMNAYLDSLPAPEGAKVDAQMAQRGRATFVGNCTQCHNVDQGKFVPPLLVDLKTLWPGYAPAVAGMRGDPKLAPVLNSPEGFDDKMIVIDASIRGEKRGNALPLLLDLARTNIFLHDASVSSLNDLLDPKRGATAPHPFYFTDAARRADMVAYLRGLDTDSR